MTHEPEGKTAHAGTGSTPRISVLLVSWNTCALTERCLESLETGFAPGERFERIVVDNGSADGSCEMLRALPLDVLVENGVNAGYAAAVNQAYARSRGELVMLLNSDVEALPGSLHELVRFLERHPEAAGVGPLYLNPDGTPQQHHYRLPTFTMMLGGLSSVLERLPPVARSIRSYRMLDDDFSLPRPVPQPSASVLLLRRSELPRSHLLDERFPIFFNDVELAARLRRAGRELWVTPDAVVIHAHGASTRLLGASLVRHHLGAQVRYLQLTQPAYRVHVFRAAALVQKLAARMLRRPGSLPVRELLPALAGDPGPLPGGGEVSRVREHPAAPTTCSP